MSDINNVIKETILDIVELTHLKLVAIAVIDKKVKKVYTFKFKRDSQSLINVIDLSHSTGIHHIIYSESY